MLISELIEELKKFNGNLPVYMQGGLDIRNARLENDLYNDETKAQDKSAVILRA